jgi:2-polyprenyl-3-methyl-5-hydroxy-6-metoxy-1,4-benzoquinol methylase
MSYIPNTETRVTTGDYLFPNSDPETPARFAALSELFDEVSIHHLTKLGVRTGWHCLEVGAGSGSIAKWLADRVGPGGHVLATDIDTSFLRCIKSPNVEVRQHNIAVDALPEATFDLVHSRLVLNHVPQRDEALQRMISALKPGGWILVEDHDSGSMPPDPVASAGEIVLRTHWQPGKHSMMVG